MPLTLLVLASAAAPPERPPSSRPTEPVTGQCGPVVVSSSQAPKARGKFSARKILDVELAAVLRKRMTGQHVLNLRVYTPKGHLYQELSVPFDAGHPSGVAEAAARGKKQPRLAARLPVGGTSISTASLYGRWKVVPHLDGSLKPCGAATAFSIVP
jgi:hypothetical protein